MLFGAIQREWIDPTPHDVLLGKYRMPPVHWPTESKVNRSLSWRGTALR
jgi:hypothetical protein